MKIIKLVAGEASPQELTQIADTFRQGGVVVYPTDTVYGLGAVIGNELAVAKIRAIKGRDGQKPVSIMVRDSVMAQAYGEVSRSVADRYLPGPYTLLVPARPGVERWISSNGQVGIRIPGHPFTLALMELMDEPVVTTSANLSGQPPVHSIAELRAQLGDKIDQVDLVIDGGELPPNPPSQIIDING